MSLEDDRRALAARRPRRSTPLQPVVKRTAAMTSEERQQFDGTRCKGCVDAPATIEIRLASHTTALCDDCAVSLRNDL